MRIALVGAYPATRLGAPFKDKDWTIWACSFRNVGVLPRWDVWFELHDPPGHDKYVAWLAAQKSVVVRTPQVKEVWLPKAEVYPEVELREKFGPFFFTSSIAYMLARAIAQQPKEIGLWGVGMLMKQEYEYQRPGCQYFIQRAWDAGIKITTPPNSSLLKPQEERW